MKLRTKLIIAFVVVMIFPVTFALIAMHAFVPGRGAEIQQLYLCPSPRSKCVHCNQRKCCRKNHNNYKSNNQFGS